MLAEKNLVDPKTSRKVAGALGSAIGQPSSIDSLIDKRFSGILPRCSPEFTTIALPQVSWAKDSRPLPILANSNSAFLFFAPSAYLYPHFQTSTIRKPTLIAASLRTEHLVQAIACYASSAPSLSKLLPTGKHHIFDIETLHIAHTLIYCAIQYLRNSALLEESALISHARYLPQLVSDDSMLVNLGHAELSIDMAIILRKMCAPSHDCTAPQSYLDHQLETWKKEMDNNLLPERIFDLLIEFADESDGDPVAHLLESAHSFILKNKGILNSASSKIPKELNVNRDLQHFFSIQTPREKLGYSARSFARSVMCEGKIPTHLAFFSRLVSLNTRQIEILDLILRTI